RSTTRSREARGSRTSWSSSGRSSRSRSRARRELRELGGRAGGELGRLRLLARRGVPVERTAGNRAVDQLHELTVPALDGRGVAALGGGRETLRQRLDRRAVAEVLE